MSQQPETSPPAPPELTGQQQNQTKWERIKSFIKDEATFFRVHIAAFIFIPLLSSIILYFCNGRFQIAYIDALFLCYSAMTDTGLATVNISTLTAWQQSLVYVLMCIGDITFVSWIMVLVRKSYFRRHCEYAAKKNPGLLSRSQTVFKTIAAPIRAMTMRHVQAHHPLTKGAGDTSNPAAAGPELLSEKNISERRSTSQDRFRSSDYNTTLEGDNERPILNVPVTSSPQSMATSLPSPSSPTESMMQRVSFAFPPSARVQRKLTTIAESAAVPKRTVTLLTTNSAPRGANVNAVNRIPDPQDRKYQGFGIPGVASLTSSLVQRAAPGVHRRIKRTFTVSYVDVYDGNVPEDKSDADTQSEQGTYGSSALTASWLKFKGLVVNRNSDFRTEELSDEQLENIGGVEYRALRLLSYLVPAYFIGTQLISFILFAPWISTSSRYNDVFAAQPRQVNKTWFSWFLVMSAYTGGGLSLVDQSMVPFQGSYLMIIAIAFVILAGNHAMPIFLRFTIWVLSKIAPKDSVNDQTLTFLLQHPRRCFVYLFPSHQTWFLTICLVLFSAVEWGAFEVLDIGIQAFEAISQGPRVIAGLFQGLAVRASGFSIVPVASMAPALQFLYIVMMYIAVYPVALSIRSTNVYEERSLGVFELPEEDEDEELEDTVANFNKLAPRQRVGRYVGWHLRRQISIDIWWLVWAVFIIAIVERRNLMDEDKKWFDLFRLLFELVSAFGGIGISLGVPYDNFSFAGGLRPLSKIVIMVIMVRGRHRGLPVAIDRAILLPHELVKTSSSNPRNSTGGEDGTEKAPRHSEA